MHTVMPDLSIGGSLLTCFMIRNIFEPKRLSCRAVAENRSETYVEKAANRFDGG